ncbi:MAG: RIP metalloprotease RseP [Candidatus Omnitrophota bacterium]
MLSLLVFLFILGILIMVHEFGHFIVSKKMGVRVERFALGFGPKLFSWARNGTEYSVRMILLGGYVKLAGDNLEEFKNKPDDFLSQPIHKRLKIIASGPIVNYLMGILFFWLIFFVGFPSLTTKVGATLDNFGGKEAGIRVGDKITQVDGKEVNYWEDLQKAIYNRQDKSRVDIKLIRDGQELNFAVNIKEESFTDIFGQKKNMGLIGISPQDEIVKVRHGFVQSFFLGIQKTANLTALTYKALWYIITGRLSLKESMTGPLGMFYITSKAVNMGLVALLHLMAVLNINLAIFNLLPIPALDGGHIFLLGVEKVRGKYLSQKVEEVFVRFGFTMLILLAAVIFFNDLSRFGVFDKLSKFLFR